MTYAELIARYPTPITASRLTHDLQRLGVASNDTLLVHASMSRIGWVCGGSQAVIEALMAAIGPRGTLVMPAHTMDVTDPIHWHHPCVPADWHGMIRASMPAFDPATTPTRDMGSIAEAFRRWPGVRRSTHPALSFAAHGPNASAILARQPLEDPLGDHAPLGVLHACEARILMIGTSYDTCTALHLAERRAWGTHPPLHHDGAPLLVGGQRRWVRYSLPAHDTEHFADVADAIEARRLAKRGLVGYADTRLLDMRAATACARPVFERLCETAPP